MRLLTALMRSICQTAHIATVCMIILKVGDVVDWSWWVVISPSAAAAALELAVMFVADPWGDS